MTRKNLANPPITKTQRATTPMGPAGTQQGSPPQKIDVPGGFESDCFSACPHIPVIRPSSTGELDVSDESKARAVQHIMATLFSAQNALRELAPEFRWAGLGNLLGDYGEFVAIKHYGLVKAPAGANGYDATTPDGKTVQIKANHAASTIGFRGEADLLLVIKVEPDGQWVERYYGPFAAVKEIARYSARDNKHMVHIRQLQALLATE